MSVRWQAHLRHLLDTQILTLTQNSNHNSNTNPNPLKPSFLKTLIHKSPKLKKPGVLTVTLKNYTYYLADRINVCFQSAPISKT